MIERVLTYAKAINEAMTIKMEEDENVFLIGEDVGVYGGAFGVSDGMLEKFGAERIMDTPVSEAAIAGVAVGAAVAGMRPIAEIMFSDFTTLAMDALVNQAAKIRYMFGGKAKVPMVLRCPEGSGTGAAAQHSQSPEAWFCHVPGLKVLAPSTPYDAKGLLIAAIEDDNPVIFFEQKLLYKKCKGPVPEGRYTIPIGKADRKREGRDITIVTYGRMVQMCLDVAEKLESDGISMEVIDLRSLVPWDKSAVIESVKKTSRLVIVHEACERGGFGGEIAATVAQSEAFHYLDAPIMRVCGVDIPIPYNPILEQHAVPTPERIENAVREAMR